jgi:hypothetical protein
MLKRIPKSDISIRPFKAYKEWSFSGSAAIAEPRIALLEAEDGNYLSTSISQTGDLSFSKRGIYGQLRAQFYNGQEDNPFLRNGNKSKSYTTAILAKERFLSGSAKVISIPNIYVGEGIKKGSVILTDNLNTSTEFSYIDDSNGNIQDSRDSIILSRIDIQNQIINFTDVADNVYSASLTIAPAMHFDLQSGKLTITYNNISYSDIDVVSIDIQSGLCIIEDLPFLPEEASGTKIGNVFYSQGLIVLTRGSANRLLNQWRLDYKSTQTIYEHEYLLIANEDEFNVSQNPTAIVEVGKETGFVSGSDGKIYKTTINPGVKYIRKKSVLDNGNILDYRFSGSVPDKNNIWQYAGFEHYEVSGSTDSTGSFLAPFITTIGLYDDNCDLVAIAKLPQPIKSEPDIPVNFIVRFDT